MKDFSQDILHTIKSEQIHPRPRWVFVTRQLAFVAGFLISVLIGGISVSIILFALADIGPGMGRMARMHPGSFLITYLPYIWVLAVIAFGALAYYDLRSIKGVYRYRTTAILGVSVLLSVIIGFVLHLAGAGGIAERRFAQMVPRYQALDARKMHFWGSPQQGMLAGTIVSVTATSTVLLDDFSGNSWVVDITRAELRDSVIVAKGERVRFAGAQTSSYVFSATDIFSWERRGMMGDLMRFGDAPIPMHERNILRNP